LAGTSSSSEIAVTDVKRRALVPIMGLFSCQRIIGYTELV
jgi:hypothetical protein